MILPWGLLINNRPACVIWARVWGARYIWEVSLDYSARLEHVDCVIRQGHAHPEHPKQGSRDTHASIFHKARWVFFHLFVFTTMESHLLNAGETWLSHEGGGLTVSQVKSPEKEVLLCNGEDTWFKILTNVWSVRHVTNYVSVF